MGMYDWQLATSATTFDYRCACHSIIIKHWFSCVFFVSSFCWCENLFADKNCKNFYLKLFLSKSLLFSKYAEIKKKQNWAEENEFKMKEIYEDLLYFFFLNISIQYISIPLPKRQQSPFHDIKTQHDRMPRIVPPSPEPRQECNESKPNQQLSALTRLWRTAKRSHRMFARCPRRHHHLCPVNSSPEGESNSGRRQQQQQQRDGDHHQ